MLSCYCILIEPQDECDFLCIVQVTPQPQCGILYRLQHRLNVVFCAGYTTGWDVVFCAGHTTG
jgi:hypothetical protein